MNFQIGDKVKLAASWHMAVRGVIVEGPLAHGQWVVQVTEHPQPSMVGQKVVRLPGTIFHEVNE